MTDKRKNLDMIAPTYEEGWLFHLCRQRGWTREETFVFNAPPDVCLEHLRSAPGRDRRFKYTIDAWDLDGSYEFKVRIEHWWRVFERKPKDIRPVIGQIIPYEGDDRKSLVTIRVYPQMTAETLIISVGYVMIMCVILKTPLFASFNLTNIQGVVSAIIAVGAMALSPFLLIVEPFSGRQRGLDIVHTIFTGDPLMPTPPTQKGKKDA